MRVRPGIPLLVFQLAIAMCVGVSLIGCGTPRNDGSLAPPGRADGLASTVTSSDRTAEATVASRAALAPPPPPNPRPAVIGGSAPRPEDDVPPIIVLEPDRPYAFPLPPGRPMMDQIATRFTPAAMIVRTGQSADFRNDDDKLHNVRVRERGQPVTDLVFNIALQQGVTYEHAFSKDGVWDVRCDMHQNMYGLVVSTSSPYATVATSEGTYSIEGVLPGQYTAIAYTSRARVVRAVTLAPGERARVDFQ